MRHALKNGALVHSLGEFRIDHLTFDMISITHARTNCGIEGRLLSWDSRSGGILHGPECMMVPAIVPREIISGGRVVGHTGQVNDAVTCEQCKNMMWRMP